MAQSYQVHGVVAIEADDPQGYPLMTLGGQPMPRTWSTTIRVQTESGEVAEVTLFSQKPFRFKVLDES